MLELQYSGYLRRVAPHVYGIDVAGEELLSCYQVWGGSESGEPADWKSFKLTEISHVKLTTKRFAPRPEYQHGDRAVARVYCQV